MARAREPGSSAAAISQIKTSSKQHGVVRRVSELSLHLHRITLKRSLDSIFRVLAPSGLIKEEDVLFASALKAGDVAAAGGGRGAA